MHDSADTLIEEPLWQLRGYCSVGGSRAVEVLQSSVAYLAVMRRTPPVQAPRTVLRILDKSVVIGG